VTRLKALAVLRAVGGKDWVDHRTEVRSAIESLQKGDVTQATLRSTVEEVDALRLLDPDVPKLSLRPFLVTDPQSEHLARLALANADMFSDAPRLRTAFRAVVDRLASTAERPTEPLVVYYTAVNAMAGSQMATDAEEHARIAAAVRTLQGCLLDGKQFAYLFRASTTTHESCSLAATWQALRSGFAYEAMR
jgi:hypothetical protein